MGTAGPGSYCPSPPSHPRDRLTAIAWVFFFLIGEKVIQGILGGITLLLLLERKQQQRYPPSNVFRAPLNHEIPDK